MEKNISNKRNGFSEQQIDLMCVFLVKREILRVAVAGWLCWYAVLSGVKADSRLDYDARCTVGTNILDPTLWLRCIAIQARSNQVRGRFLALYRGQRAIFCPLTNVSISSSLLLSNRSDTHSIALILKPWNTYMVTWQVACM